LFVLEDQTKNKQIQARPAFSSRPSSLLSPFVGRRSLPGIVFLQNKQIHYSILFEGDVFEFFEDLIEGGLLIIDGFTGTVDAFDAPESQADSTERQNIPVMIHFLFAHGNDDAVGKVTEAFFFIIKFSRDLLLQTLFFCACECSGIEAMFNGIIVAGRSTMGEGIGVAGLTTTLTMGT